MQIILRSLYKNLRVISSLEEPRILPWGGVLEFFSLKCYSRKCTIEGSSIGLFRGPKKLKGLYTNINQNKYYKKHRDYSHNIEN